MDEMAIQALAQQVLNDAYAQPECELLILNTHAL